PLLHQGRSAAARRLADSRAPPALPTSARQETEPDWPALPRADRVVDRFPGGSLPAGLALAGARPRRPGPGVRGLRRPGSRRAQPSAGALSQIRREEPLGSARQPRLGHDFLELLRCDSLEADQNRRIALEVRGGEVDARIVREQRLLAPTCSTRAPSTAPSGASEPSSANSFARRGRSQTNSFSPTRHCSRSRELTSLAPGSPSARRRTSSQSATSQP